MSKSDERTCKEHTNERVSFVRSTYSDFPNFPGDSPLDIFLKPALKLKAAISFIYNQIMLLRPQTLNFTSLWEEDLGKTISEDLWIHNLSLVFYFCQT